jgi:alkylation response protein AidB-like acyl-CoA dehydrogenase
VAPFNVSLPYHHGTTDSLSSAKLYEIGAGTSEIRRMVIGRAFNKEYANV